MNTTAENYLNATRKNLMEAVENLSRIVVDKCSGHDELNLDKSKVNHIFFELMEIRDKLGEYEHDYTEEYKK